MDSLDVLSVNHVDEIAYSPMSEIHSPSSYNSSQSENLCRICLMSVDENRIKTYCLCDGSTKIIHKHCLLRWILEGKRETCEICNYKFKIIKNFKFNWVQVISFGFIFIGVSAVCIFILTKYNTHNTLLVVLLIVFMGISWYYFKSSTELYVLKSLDIIEIESENSETTRLID
jgi:E3 ubiquitin-protein ligase DOA10